MEEEEYFLVKESELPRIWRKKWGWKIAVRLRVQGTPLKKRYLKKFQEEESGTII